MKILSFSKSSDIILECGKVQGKEGTNVEVRIEDVVKELVSSEKESRDLVQEAKRKSENLVNEARKNGKRLVESKIDEANELAREMMKTSKEKMRINEENILNETRQKIMSMREMYLNVKDKMINDFLNDFLEVENDG